MKQLLVLSFIFLSFTISAAEENCKTVKSCSEWATFKTAKRYDLGKYERRSLKLEKDFSLKEGDADFIFNFILQSNDLVRLKRDNDSYQIIALKDIKDFQFPTVKAEEIPATMDYYTTEFSLGNAEKVKNALIILKKQMSKNTKILEVADAPKLQMVATGIELNAIKLIITELNK
jgi:hypothetical protein